MRYIVLGAGAIGGVTAAFMTKGGCDVTVVCRNEKTAKALCAPGLKITGRRGEATVPLAAVCGTAELSGKYDCCIVATKAYDTVQAVSSLIPYLSDDGIVLVLQNGICIDALLSVLPAHNAACGVTTWSCTMISPTHMDFTGEGGFIIGMAKGGEDARLARIRDDMSLAAETKISENIIADMYSKLIINSGITCGGALTGQLLGQMLKGKDARKFFIAIVYEAMAVAEAIDLKVPPFGGKLDYYKFISGSSIFDNIRRHAMLFVVGVKYRKLKSSSLTSLQRGKPTEVSALNGWICKKADEYGVCVPVNKKLCELISEIEAGKRKSTPENLKYLI